MMDKQLAWLESAQIQRPGAAAELSDLGELYDRKLWHQLTLKLDVALDRPAFQQDDFLIQLYRWVGIVTHNVFSSRAFVKIFTAPT